MIVYVETNFLFELATGRDKNDTCRMLVDWCREQRIALRLPATAFIETRTALRRRASIQLGVARDLKDQFDDAKRVRDSDIARAYETAETHLVNTAKGETNRLRAVSEELFQVATLIRLDREILEMSERFREFKVLTGDSDLLILASIIRDLELRKSNGDASSSLFVTGDADFSNGRKWLKPFSCDLLTSYSAAVARLKAQLE